MCGIAGFITSNSLSHQNSRELLSKMTAVLSHRGPDSEGFFFAKDNRIGLGHRRLSIQDLSDSGNQPMHSFCKNYSIVFNGEIYNFHQLRNKLQDIPFNGSSDTEVLVNFIAKFGIYETLDQAKGQFAFAVMDHNNARLYLARDIIGEKPLYFFKNDQYFLFSSELTSIQSTGFVNCKVNNVAVDNFLRYSYVPNPMTIFDGVQKLQPGHLFKIDINNLSIEGELERFYDLPSRINEYDDQFLYQNEEILFSQFESLLDNSVNSQLISDAPLGGLLSGGIDSSLICAIANERIKGKLSTFTIGFEEADFDESRYAKKVADYIGTDHHELILTPTEILNDVPSIINKFDEPFADSSQIPTFFVMKHASEQVKVVLSGDGGDELFGGYNRYLHVEKVWPYLNAIPKTAKPLLKSSAKFLPIEALNKVNLFGLSQLGIKLEKLLSKSGSVTNKTDLFISMIRENVTDDFLNSNQSKHPLIDELDQWPKSRCFKNQMMLIDMLTYLPDDILTKVDRSSMMNSIESRAPFLDKELIEFSINLPISFKIRNNKTKFILRNALKKRIPENLFERPKMGFSIPVSNWLKRDLREWVFSVFEDPIHFEKNLLNRTYNQFLKGNFSHTLLWNIVVLESWLQSHNLQS